MNASAAADLFPGIEVIDAHAHLGRWGLPGLEGTTDDLRRLLDASGIARVIVSSAMAIAYDVPGGNAEVAAACDADERIYGSIVFNARYPQQCREQIDRYADHPRFVATKYHTGYDGLPINAPENLRVIEWIAARELPLTLHTWTGDGTMAADVARRFPELPVFWFHALAADYRKAADLASELPNVYLDFITSTQERGKIETLVERLGADRIVFGTDQSLFDPIRAMGAVAEARLGDDDRRRILGGTARRVFRFAGN